MAEQGEGQEKRKGGKGKLLKILAAIGAILAAVMFWRRRRAPREEEE